MFGWKEKKEERRSSYLFYIGSTITNKTLAFNGNNNQTTGVSTDEK
jgi:hypothetical protein